MTEHPIAFYARQLRPALPANLFAPVRSRLVWLALHVALAAAGISVVALGWGGWPVALALSLVIGHSFAGMAFVGHEVLHGAVIRSPRWRYLVGALCFVPFWVSARLWVAWHNRVHHGNTGRADVDPDAFPTLAAYRASLATRVADHLSFGGRRLTSVITLLVGFNLQSTQVLWRRARHPDYLTPRQHTYAVLEWLGAAALWTGLGLLIGGGAFLFAYVLPLFVANSVVMSYIMTNHSLSPLTESNDPLLNSLTVTAPRVIEWLHLDFGYHVEHHLFPAMSSARAREVRALLQARWPTRYQSMPIGRALRLLFITPRVYVDAVTLVEPHTGRRWPTLPPGPAPDDAEAPQSSGVLITAPTSTVPG